MRPSLSLKSLSTLLVLLLCFGCPVCTLAQITSDRPGFADGGATVAPGTFQTEIGYAFNRENELTTHDLGQVLLRVGIIDQFEIRGGVGSYVVSDGENGYDGAELGVKLTVFSTRRSALGAVASTTIPVGTIPSAPDPTRQTIKLSFDGALNNHLAFTVNSGTSFVYARGSQSERSPEGIFQAAFGTSLTESLSIFIGYAGYYGKVANRSWGEAGLTLLATQNIQIDVNGGIRIDDNADSVFFLGAAFSQRLLL